VRVINATPAHHFAKALLKRAKTEALAAHTLARRAALLQPAPWSPPPALYEELRQRLAQRDALIVVRQPVRNQRQALLQGPHVVGSVRERMEALLGALDAPIAEVEAERATVVAQETAWTDAIKRLQGIPGVGLLTAAWVAVGRRNFTRCATAEQATAYAGLAPMPRQSGSSLRGRATIGRGGNARDQGAAARAQDGGIEARVVRLEPQDGFPVEPGAHRVGGLAVGQPLGELADRRERQPPWGQRGPAAAREERRERVVGEDRAERIGRGHGGMALREGRARAARSRRGAHHHDPPGGAARTTASSADQTTPTSAPRSLP